MKHLALLSIFVLAGLLAAAQQSLTIPYQALVRDANGSPIVNQEISASITLISDSLDGTTVYDETHTVTTNSFGQINLEIGSVKPADFDTIPWDAGKIFIKLKVDLEGGNNLREIATMPFLAVPYAKYAENAKYAEEGSGWEKTEKGIAFKNGNVQIQNN